jgi:predicted nuclease of predicted toxin-antitoxin system
MKILVDMNLSPAWIDVFKSAGIEAMHWSTVGEPGASDREIMRWARERGYVVFTHDLDFGAILAATQAEGPSVLQLRAANVLPETVGKDVLNAIRRFEPELKRGVLISLDTGGARARLFPLRSSEEAK